MRATRAAVAAVIVATVTALGVGTVSPVAADDLKDRKRRVDASLSVLKQDLDDSSQSLVAAVTRQQAALALLPPAEQAVARTTAQLQEAQQRNAAIGVQLAIAQGQEEEARRELVKVVDQMVHTQQIIGRIARRAYQGDTMSELAVALESETPDDFATRVVLLRSVLRSENNIFDGLDATRADVDARGDALEAKRIEIAQLKQAAEDQVAAVTSLQASAKAARDRIGRLVARAAAARLGVEREKAADVARLRAAEAESRRLGAVLVQRARLARIRAAKARAAAIKAGRRWVGGGGLLSVPVLGPVTSGFGMRVHPITGIRKLHDGTDFGVACGTPIHAAAAGEVIETGTFPAWGKRVIIDHGLLRGEGVATGYNHMTRYVVRSGQRISRGQLVGYVGSTGFSTGCHLHLNVYVNGNAVNPMKWL